MLSRSGYWRFARLALRAGLAPTALTALAVAVAAIVPVGTVAAIGAVVDAAPKLIAAGLSSPEGRAALWWAVVVGGLFLLQWAAGALQTAATTALGERVDALLQRDLMAAVMEPDGIGHLEDPGTLDLINVGRETFRAGWGRPGRLAATVSGLVAGRAVLVGSCLIVGHFHPLLGVLLLIAGLWSAHEDRAASRAEAAHHYGSTELARRTEYFYELGVTQPPAKEVRVFGLSDFLMGRFTAMWHRSMSDIFAPANRTPLIATAAVGAVILSGIVWIAREAAVGQIGVGSAVAYAMALMVSLSGVRQSSWSGLQTELALATLRRYEEAIVSAQPVPNVNTVQAVAQDKHLAEGLPHDEIRFERVSFSYSDGVNALQDLDLVIPAGTSLAIVGANGAGKTTLVKLLCRMYEPTSGQISVDGIDLARLDIPSWRRQLAAVFQDSTHFALSARTNVAFGRVDAAGDRESVEAAGVAACVADAIGRLPRGWDTPLSSEYAGGVDLSGGEWQKVGLARALFATSHGARVLILDEPAAHLDARAEAQLYEQFLSLTEGLTTIVISHRFSTVRQAESIIVLDEGRIVEQGTHEDLAASNGAYAVMFQLQASRFAQQRERTEHDEAGRD